MRARRTHLAFVAAAASSVAAFVAACATETERPTFDPGDAGDEATANLPDAAEPTDVFVPPEPRDPFDTTDEPVACGDAGAGSCAVQLVAGRSHFCARMSDGTVRCWGNDELGQLGAVASGAPDAGADAGKTDAGAAPFRVRKVARISDITQLAAGGASTCARRQDGTVFCWGSNLYGELGGGTNDGDPHPDPVIIDVGGPSVRVDVGQSAACALRTNGKVVCWGRDDQLQLARTELDGGDRLSIAREPGPAAVDALGFVGTRLGDYTTFGVTSTGELWSWGALAGNEGVLGGRLSSLSPSLAPRRLPDLEKVTSAAASVAVEPPAPEPPPGQPPPNALPFRAHACAIANGELFCWGRSYGGALCTGLPDPEVKPAKALVKSRAWPQQVAVGDEITCVRMTNGTVQCCGTGRRGRLGTGGELVLSALLVEATALKGRAVSVATSDSAVCALMKDGSVQCWGDNERGELGQEQKDDASHSSPVAVRF